MDQGLSDLKIIKNSSPMEISGFIPKIGMVRSQLASVGPDSAQLQELRAVVAACRREARHGRAEGEA